MGSGREVGSALLKGTLWVSYPLQAGSASRTAVDLTLPSGGAGS